MNDVKQNHSIFVDALPVPERCDLSLATIPTRSGDVERYYRDAEVQKAVLDFDRSVSIGAVAADLSVTVDLVALAHQKSSQEGLKCAPLTARIKTGYLDIVSTSNSTVRGFRERSKDAVFKLASAGAILARARALVDRTAPTPEQLKLIGDQLAALAKKLESMSSEEIAYQLGELRELKKQLGLTSDENAPPMLFVLETEVRKATSALSVAKAEAEKRVEAQRKHVAAALEEIAECSRFAAEMKQGAKRLADKARALQEVASEALIKCAEQDVEEKDKRQKLKERVQQQQQRQAELTKLESDLNEQIEDLLQKEKRLEEQMESASSRAFWIGIVSSVAGVVAGGLNAYVTYSTGGLNQVAKAVSERQNDVNQRVESERREKEEAKARAESELRDATNRKKELTDERDTLAKQQREIAEKLQKVGKEIAELEKTAPKDGAESSKLKEKRAEEKELRDQLNRTENDLEKKERELWKAASREQEKERIARASAVALEEFSKKAVAFEKAAQSELEGLRQTAERVDDTIRDLRETRREAASELAGLVVALGQAADSAKDLDQVIRTLELVSETLLKIVASFSRLQRFWEGLEENCLSLSDKGKSLETRAGLLQAESSGDLVRAIDDLAGGSFLELVRSWIALACVNDLTLGAIEKVTVAMEKTMVERVDVEALVEKLSHALLPKDGPVVDTVGEDAGSLPAAAGGAS